MIFAIVNEGKVVNIAEGNHPLTVDWIQVDNGVPVGIGDTYDGMAFYNPEGRMRMSYVQTKTQNQINDIDQSVNALNKDGTLKTAQIQALSDMLDFYEDCIAEMASVVYA